MDALKTFDEVWADRGMGVKIARHFNISPTAVYKWRDNRVPATKVIELAELTGLSRSQIRPDIYPPDGE